MLDTDREIDHPPTSQAVRRLRQMKQAGEPLTLVVNGTIQLTVEDDASYQKLEELVDWLDRVAILRERLEDFKAGKPGISLEAAREAIRQKHGIPR